MRVLYFDSTPESSQRFGLIYQGFLFGTPEGGLRGFEVNRRANKIFDKLEALSEPVLQGTPPVPVQFPSGDVLRGLKGEGGKLQLEDAEYTLLKSFLEAVPWTTASARGVSDLADFFESAATE